MSGSPVVDGQGAVSPEERWADLDRRSEARDERDAALASLAAAEEREQRLRAALQEVYDLCSKPGVHEHGATRSKLAMRIARDCLAALSAIGDEGGDDQ